jgi:hypothetical protein
MESNFGGMPSIWYSLCRLTASCYDRRVEILDGKWHGRAAQPFHLARIVGFLNGGRHWGWLSHPETARNYQPEQIERADRLFVKSFRALVDQWIDSGKQAGGTESPLSRNVNAVPPGSTQPLFDVLATLLRRNWLRPVLLRTGKFAIQVQRPSDYTMDGDGRVRYRDPEEYAKECSISHFAELLDTPGANRVGRCNNPKCGRYYIRRRLRKSEIKRGSFCLNCVGAGSVQRTRASREERKQRLVNLAADCWRDWQPQRRFGKQTNWVAAQINKRSDAAITGKWVSQNLAAIKGEIEHRKSAEG